MANSSDYIAYLQDSLSNWARVSARRMFGGHGLFRDGMMFAIVVDDQLYLKADTETAAAFCEQGSERFSYLKKEQRCYINYYSAPEACLDDAEALQHWAALAYDTALRAR